jgi:hypothetical protein
MGAVTMGSPPVPPVVVQPTPSATPVAVDPPALKP